MALINTDTKLKLKEMGFNNSQILKMNPKTAVRVQSRFYKTPWTNEFTLDEMITYITVQEKLFLNY